MWSRQISDCDRCLQNSPKPSPTCKTWLPSTSNTKSEQGTFSVDTALANTASLPSAGADDEEYLGAFDDEGLHRGEFKLT